ncbi:WD40-repeat-containing domain protein [Infundibulicybe gibba]|nr:WD40-repeat-containing domain protein [Infundibulicybe gibba]
MVRLATPQIAGTEYTLHAELKGSMGAINALAFSKDGKLLLSGGDDECIRLWNMVNFKCEQTLRNERWGQVTVINWLTQPPTGEKRSSACVGTGRGSLTICILSMNGSLLSLQESATLFPFDFNDAVETQAYDTLNHRLAVASHSGLIKMFSVENGVTLTTIWSAIMNDAIPRGLVFFGGGNQNLAIHGLETGEMTCRDAQTANVLWTKTLACGIGNAVLSPDETTLVVDNLTSGLFDVYHFPDNTPIMSLSMKPTRRFAKQCAFGESMKVVVCGSDNGNVQVVDLGTGSRLQSLQSARDHTFMIQAVATTTTDRRHLIASGSASTTPVIYLWEKKIPITNEIAERPTRTASGLPKQALINSLLVFLIFVVSYPNWSVYFWKLLASASLNLARAADILANFSNARG